MLVVMGPRGELRAADTDREAVAERLRAALEEGRLDLYEYDERLGQAYAARTYDELDGLLADLPRPVAEQPDPVARSGRSGRRPRPPAPPWLAELWRPWVRVVSICAAIWAVSAIASVTASGDLPYFWPFWVAVPWGAVLVFIMVRGLAGGASGRRAEGSRAGTRAAVAGPDPADAPVEQRMPGRRGCC